MTDDARARPRPALSSGAATLAVVGAAVGFSTISIATVVATRDGTPLTSVVIGRFFLTALLLLAFSGGWRGLRVDRAHARKLLVWGGVGQSLINILNLSALAYIPAATVVFLFYTFPAWVAVFAAIRGTERVGPVRIGALLLSLAGIVTILGGPGSGAIVPLGAALALSGAFVYALYIPLLRQLQHGIPSSAALFHIAIGVCVSLLLYGAVRGELAWRVSSSTAGAIVWLAVVPTVLAFQLFLRGLATLGPVKTAIISTAEPFCAALFAAVVLDQPVTASTMAGGALIAVAVLLLQRHEPAPSATTAT